jgi:short-subunit dehydrogenase
MFKDKVVLITGGSKGIGRETARLFLKDEAVVYICGRNQEALDAAAHDLGGSIHTITADVSDPGDCASMIERIKSEASRLDILINNAGMSMRGNIEQLSPKVIHDMFSINTMGAVYLTTYALPLIRESRGSVVFISSLSAFYGLPGISVYGASKRALRAIAESLRAETCDDGVHVGLVYVGFTENDPDKQVYDAEGTLIGLNRPRSSQTQAETASAIVSSIRKRKNISVLTRLGKLSYLMFRLLPNTTGRIAVSSAKKSSMYGVEKDG